MAHIFADRVMETTTTSGTGSLALAGAVTGYRTFDAVMDTNDTCYYAIEEIDLTTLRPTGDWETGLGTLSASTTLDRTTVITSSNSNNAVNLAAGTTKRVFLAAVALIDGINGLTEDANPDESADFFTTYDVSAAGLKKVKIANVMITASQVSNFTEAAQDAVGSILIDSSTVDLRYADDTGTGTGGGGAISASVIVAGLSGIDHGSQLTGLSDDDHTQYALLVGRSGGQALTGGTGSGDDLTLRASSHGTPGEVYVAKTDAATNSATTVLVVAHNSSGTAAAGFGSALMFCLESSTTDDQDAAVIEVNWSVATHTSRRGRMVLKCYEQDTAVTGLTLLPASTTAIAATVNGTLTVSTETSATSTATTLLTISQTTTGTAAASFGSDILFTLESDSGSVRNVSLFRGMWQTATDATRLGAFRIGVYDVTNLRTAVHTEAGTGGANVGLCGAPSNFGSGVGLVCVTNVVTAPSSNPPSSSFFLFSNSAAPTFHCTAGGQVLLVNAGTNDVTAAWTLTRRNTSGTPAAGFGTSLNFQLESSSTNDQNAAKITATWGVATHGSREGVLSLYATDVNADRLGMQITGNTSATEIGFFGATPVVQPSGTGETTGFTAGAGTAVRDDSTFTGNVGSTAYRISDVVKALKNLGLLAQ